MTSLRNNPDTAALAVLILVWGDSRRAAVFHSAEEWENRRAEAGRVDFPCRTRAPSPWDGTGLAQAAPVVLQQKPTVHAQS